MQDRMILERDPLGLKPLYYYQSSKGIIHASSVSELLKNPSVPQKPNESMIGQYLAGEFLDYESTFFEGIKQVPPGHALVLKKDRQPVLERRWLPESIKPRHYQNKNQYLEEFFYLFEKSVYACMQTDSPVGLLLSGGLDSVQICAMAETLRRKNKIFPPLKSACLLAEGFLAEEKTALDRLREHYDSDIEIINYAASQKFKSLFELFLEPGETPHWDAYLTTPLLLENLRARGCKVLLTGFGANELSNPMEFGYLEDLLVSFQFGKFAGEAKRFAQTLHTSGTEVMRMIFFEALREKTPVWARRLARESRLLRRKWLRKEFRKKISACPPPRLRPFGKLAQDKTYHALFEPQISLGLAQMREAAAKYGMEIRHPFLDLPLIEFFLSIPAEIKMEGGYRKNFVQQALAGMMPFPVRTVDDERCDIPYPQEQARKTVELSRLQHYLWDPANFIYEYVEYPAIQAMLSPARNFFNYPFLWRLVRLENWLRSFWGKRFFIDDFTDSKRYNFAQQAT